MVNIIGEERYPGGAPAFWAWAPYHTGYRAFSRQVLETINYEQNSDDFVFDNEMLSQIIYAGFDIAEVTCLTKYFKEASSINFRRSVKYGLGVLRVSLGHFFQRLGIVNLPMYQSKHAGH